MKGLAFYEKDFFTFKHDSTLHAEGLKRILMTNPGERVGQPYFGVGLRNLLFELADEKTENLAKSKMLEQIDIYMPMLSITTIDSKIENNSFFVTIVFIEKGDLPDDERILTLEFEDEVIKWAIH